MIQIQAPNLVSHCESHSQLKACCNNCFGFPWDICEDRCDWMVADGTLDLVFKEIKNPFNSGSDWSLFVYSGIYVQI